MDSNALEERFIWLLCHAVLHKVIEEDSINYQDFDKAGQNLVAAFRYDRGGRGLYQFDLTQITNTCAYFKRYAAFSANLVRHRMREVFENCEHLQAKMRSPELEIIDLGSGPGTDVVGFCSALCEQQDLKECKQLNFTLVDNVRLWSRFATSFTSVTRTVKYGRTSELFRSRKVSTLFLEKDVENQADGDYAWKLKCADIIMVVRLLSHVKSPSSLISVSSIKHVILTSAIDSLFRGYTFRHYLK